MQEADDKPMMRSMRANKHFTSSALCGFGALICLCLSLGVYTHKPSKASSEDSFSSLHKRRRESTSSPHRGAAKSIAGTGRVSVHMAMRDKHSPLHPDCIPPNQISGLSLNSLLTPLNSFADIRSLIFLSPLQNRAPPHNA
jgi:hypothetical protein